MSGRHYCLSPTFVFQPTNCATKRCCGLPKKNNTTDLNEQATFVDMDATSTDIHIVKNNIVPISVWWILPLPIPQSIDTNAKENVSFSLFRKNGIVFKVGGVGNIPNWPPTILGASLLSMLLFKFIQTWLAIKNGDQTSLGSATSKLTNEDDLNTDIVSTPASHVSKLLVIKNPMFVSITLRFIEHTCLRTISARYRTSPKNIDHSNSYTTY